MTPQQILRAAGGAKVPGLSDGDLGAAAGAARMDNVAWQDFGEARRRGYLWLGRRREPTDTAAVWWGWWCHACKIPELVIRHETRAGTSLRCDLSPTGLLFLPSAILPIGQAVRDAAPGFGRRWIVSPDTVEVEELAAEGALSLAQALLRLAKDRRFVQAERTPPRP